MKPTQESLPGKKKCEKEPKQEEHVPSAPELLPLFRLLMKEPPQGHDFKTCAVCKQYGIDRI